VRLPGGRRPGGRRPAERRSAAPAKSENKPLVVRDPEKLAGRMPWGLLFPLIPGDDARRTEVVDRLRHFVLELLKWNMGVSNLVSHDDERRLVERHVVESLVGIKIFKALECNEILDFGSGGGFPALPLAIAGIGADWTLVESRRNKTLFLRRAIQELKLTNVHVITGRLEVLVEEDPEALRCDGFTSRATSKLAPTIALAARIVRPGGYAVLWKGSGLSEELQSSKDELARNWSEPVVERIGEGPNSVVVLQRKEDD
jgi:16S rRNA (guanine527-N7)-methyltransferase